MLYMKLEKLQVPFFLASETHNISEACVTLNVTGIYFPSRHLL